MIDRNDEIMQVICDGYCRFPFTCTEDQLDDCCAACPIDALITAAVASGRYEGFRLGIAAAGNKNAPSCEGAQPGAHDLKDHEDNE